MTVIVSEDKVGSDLAEREGERISFLLYGVFRKVCRLNQAGSVGKVFVS